MAPDGEFRVEHDTMGEVRVPKAAKWQAQTQRAYDNFPTSGRTVDAALIHAIALIKRAAVLEGARQKHVAKDVADAIAAAAHEVSEGRWDDHFVLDAVFQTGSGTSSNMNVNEVLATLAGERLGREIRPNDEPNFGQSSNDVFPSAIHVAATRLLTDELLPALDHLAKALRRKQREFKTVVKSGRTHLMDATPVTLGQEFGGYAQAIENGRARVDAVLPRVGELPLGGTAVGTGINAPKGFGGKVTARLAAELGLPLTEARDHFEAQGARDSLVECSGVLKTVAVSLYKIANDLRWMNSGPRAGLSEIRLPDLQPGSSIMPGKVNPVIPEAVCQVVAQVVGNDAAITFAGAAGNFELNVMLPVMGRNLLESVRLLALVSRALADECVAGIEANVERCQAFAESSPSIGTSLNPVLGYERVAEIIKESTKSGRSIRDIVLERKLMTAAELDRALDVLSQTKGGLAK